MTQKRNMKKRNLAFTVELLGLFMLLVLVITVVTQVFVMSRSHSLQAKQLTEAVILAESTAEVSSTEKDMLQLSGKIGSMENVMSTGYVSDGAQTSEGEIWAGAVFKPGDDGKCRYIIRVSRKSTPSGEGEYAEDDISIYSAEDVLESAGQSGDTTLSDAEAEDIAGLLSQMGSMQGDGAITEDGSTAGISLPEPVYTLKAGKYFGEDK